MISQQELDRYQREALETLRRAAIVVTPEEAKRIEIADFGLGRFEQTGLAVLVYLNTQRCCAKELVMWPRQTCPEHRHPDAGGEPGKEETFRCRFGKVFLYVSGEPVKNPQCKTPPGRENTYSVLHEIELNPGDQYTLLPDTLHWFQAGADGAVVSEFSTRSRDESDVFTDPQIQRATLVGQGAPTKMPLAQRERGRG
jgi:D-lyxose ketol-isomerase